MDGFDNLSDDELKQIFLLLKPYSDRVDSIIQQEFELAGDENDSALYVLRDEAFGHYWKRVIDKRSNLDRYIVDILLNCSDFPTSKSLLGDAIIEQKIEIELCEVILRGSERSGWLYRQAKSSILINCIESGEVDNNLEELMNLKCMWAINRLIIDANEEILNKVSDYLATNESIAKKEKNRIINKIRHRLKNINRFD